MKMTEMILMDVNKDLESKQEELKACGLFDVLDKYLLKKEIRELETHRRALIRTGLSEGVEV